MTIRYVDLENGNDANDGSSFALRKKTIASAAAGLGGGDTVRIMASPDPTAMGQSATWANGSDTVTLASAVTANIDTCESAWTAAANVTATASTTAFREGLASANLAIAAGFATGKVAHHATGALDLSAYQQVSFLARMNVTKAAGTCHLALCSDTTGDVPVHTIPLPAITANYWTPVVWDNGAALSSSIQSVALYADVDPGSITVNVDNIIACKAPSAPDSLTHLSLISKNTTDEPWFAIDSINGTTVVLGTGKADLAGRSYIGTPIHCAYYGASETVALFKRQPIVLAAAAALGAGGTTPDTPLGYEFGWSRTDMAAQNSVTWVRSGDPSLTAVGGVTYNCVFVNKLYCVASGGIGLYMTGIANRVGEYGAAACAVGLQYHQCPAFTLEQGKFFVGCETGIKTSGGTYGFDIPVKAKKLWGIGISTSYGLNDIANVAYGYSLVIDAASIRNHQAGLRSGSTLQKVTLKNILDWSNTKDIDLAAADVIAYGCADFTFTATYTRKRLHKVAGVAGNHKIYWADSPASPIVSDTAVRHTASGISWKFSPLSAGASGINALAPMSLPVAKIACAANEARTVKLWYYRDNTALSMRLRLPGGQLAGVDADVAASMTAAANTWEEVSISFTPTEAGVVEIFAEAWGGTAYNGWVDDLTVL